MSSSYISRLSRSVLNTLNKARDPFEVGLRKDAVSLFEFRDAGSVDNWRVGSDHVFGGHSTGELLWVSDEHNNRGVVVDDGDVYPDGTGTFASDNSAAGSVVPFLRFSGIYSKRIDASRAHPNMKKSGFVSMTGRPLDTLDSYVDLESYRALRYTIRVHKNSLHRTFLANLRSDNWVTGGQMEDVWHAVLHDGETDGGRDGYDGWKEVEVPLEAFVLTWRGKPVAEAVEMGKSKILSLGIGLLGGDARVEEEGEFCLDLRRVEGVV
jgi:hypothetical protein